MPALAILTGTMLALIPIVICGCHSGTAICFEQMSRDMQRVVGNSHYQINPMEGTRWPAQHRHGHDTAGRFDRIERRSLVLARRRVTVGGAAGAGRRQGAVSGLPCRGLMR